MALRELEEEPVQLGSLALVERSEELVLELPRERPQFRQGTPPGGCHPDDVPAAVGGIAPPLHEAAFMVILDVAIVNVALPSIKSDLGFSQRSLQWVVSAYAILFGGTLLLGGRLADVLGRRRLFFAGLALFAVSSLLCGLAWSEGRSPAGRPAALRCWASLDRAVRASLRPAVREV